MYWTDAAVCRGSAGILPAVLEFQERARSRRDAGATETIVSSHWIFQGIGSPFGFRVSGIYRGEASPHSARISASVRTQEEFFAASRILTTSSSFAGIPCLSSQYSTFDFPLMGPTSITCSNPKRDRKSTRLNSSHSQISYAV